jgi:HSP20 family protein
MPSIHYLNPPTNPFWDFVAGLEDHPIFAAYARPPNYAPGNTANPQAGPAAQAEQPAAEKSEKARGKQASVEDPPEVDPSTLRDTNNTANNHERAPEGCHNMPFHGSGRWAHAFEDGPDGFRRGHGCRGRGGFEGRGGHAHRGGGPPPFMFGPHGPWGARRGPGFEGHGRPGPHHHNHRGQHPPHWGPNHSGFNLGEFLNNLGQRLGIDLSSAAEGLGLDCFTSPRNNDADFEPRADIFDTPESYIIHLSLPGAKKSDVGVDWDGENSVLRIAGVVHRPGATEELLSHLVIDGRKRETGVFEKTIRLGTRSEPASIDVAGISAKMTDGVLVVTVPKVEVEHKKREVPISGSGAPSPARNEKESLIDADEIEMHDAEPVLASETAKAKEAEYQAEVKANQDRDDRSETMDFEHAEELPEYEAEAEHEESDWEKDGSEDEGEYVKINVD